MISSKNKKGFTKFDVKNKYSLTKKEVSNICRKLKTKSFTTLFENGSKEYGI